MLILDLGLDTVGMPLLLCFGFEKAIKRHHTPNSLDTENTAPTTPLQHLEKGLYCYDLDNPCVFVFYSKHL